MSSHMLCCRLFPEKMWATCESFSVILFQKNSGNNVLYLHYQQFSYFTSFCSNKHLDPDKSHVSLKGMFSSFTNGTGGILPADSTMCFAFSFIFSIASKCCISETPTVCLFCHLQSTHPQVGCGWVTWTLHIR